MIKSIVSRSARSLEPMPPYAEVLTCHATVPMVQIAVLAGQVLLYTCPWWTRMRYYVDLSYR